MNEEDQPGPPVLAQMSRPPMDDASTLIKELGRENRLVRSCGAGHGATAFAIRTRFPDRTLVESAETLPVTTPQIIVIRQHFAWRDRYRPTTHAA